MAGDSVTGVTIFQIMAGLDSGPIALVRHEPLRRDDTAGTLAERLAPIGAQLLVETLDATEAGALELSEQPEDGVTYADKIDPSERRLDPGRPAAELERIVRALMPGIGAYLEFENGERLGVEAARVVDAAVPSGHLSLSEERLILGCGEGALELLRVKPAGKRAMSAAEFVRGHQVPERALGAA
jgi:methionyl-tRNA formyltransferase